MSCRRLFGHGSAGTSQPICAQDETREANATPRLLDLLRSCMDSSSLVVMATCIAQLQSPYFILRCTPDTHHPQAARAALLLHTACSGLKYTGSLYSLVM